MRKRLLINTVIIVWAIAAGIFASIRPWQVYQKQNEESKVRVKEMSAAEANRDELLKKEGHAQSSIGREEAARKAGYLGPGEVPLEAKKN